MSRFRASGYDGKLNAESFVWSHMKKNGVSKKPPKQNESLRKRVEEDLLKINANPALVRSSLHADRVACAAG